MDPDLLRFSTNQFNLVQFSSVQHWLMRRRYPSPKVTGHKVNSSQLETRLGFQVGLQIQKDHVNGNYYIRAVNIYLTENFDVLNCHKPEMGVDRVKEGNRVLDDDTKIVI